MADTMNCPTCGAPNQEIGKFCEQCGSRVEPADGAAPADVAPTDMVAMAEGDGAPGDGDSAPPADDASGDGDSALTSGDGGVSASAGDSAAAGASGTPRFVRVENGQPIPSQSFEVPEGATLLLGRADPLNGIFPEVDLTPWARRVRTPDGDLFTIHRRQCFISRGADGRVRIRDHEDYLGDTLVSAGKSGQFRPIPTLADEREGDEEGAIVLEAGDRILMGQGEGMLIFELVTA